MPIYFLLSIWVLLSVGREPTPQAYFERGALFYNALTTPTNWRRVRSRRFSIFQYAEYAFTVQWKVLDAFVAAVSIGTFPGVQSIRGTMTDSYQSSGEPESRGIMP